MEFIGNAEMKCKKNKKCHSKMQCCAKNGYICCGLTAMPSKYKNDIIKLCLSTKQIKALTIEMTPSEALYIASCLTTTLANITKN